MSTSRGPPWVTECRARAGTKRDTDLETACVEKAPVRCRPPGRGHSAPPLGTTRRILTGLTGLPVSAAGAAIVRKRR
ncbi:hypothetical protein GCM10010103_73120 [Streptomyces paradoxus]